MHITHRHRKVPSAKAASARNSPEVSTCVTTSKITMGKALEFQKPLMTPPPFPHKVHHPLFNGGHFLTVLQHLPPRHESLNYGFAGFFKPAKTLYTLCVCVSGFFSRIHTTDTAAQYSTTRLLPIYLPVLSLAVTPGPCQVVNEAAVYITYISCIMYQIHTCALLGVDREWKIADLQ